MLQITDIPYLDIEDYLKLNNQLIPKDKNVAYQEAYNLIHSDKQLRASPVIADWIIANNLSKQSIKTYKASTILTTPDKNLEDLAVSLSLLEVNKERILRILSYIGKLDNDMNVFNSLPIDILKDIFLHLDCKTVLLACKLSTTFSAFCNQKLSEILKQRLSEVTKLNTLNYTQSELTNLCRISPKPQYINCNRYHTLIITIKGLVYGFGRNFYGELGLNDINYRDKPTLIENLTDIIQVATGDNHSLTLNKNGQVYAFGNNEQGQLGLGNNENVRVPILIENLSSIIQISAGSEHSLLLSIAGQIYAFGSGFMGELGLRERTEKNIATLIPTLNNIIQISTGGLFSLALSDNGEVYTWGSNDFGQLGLGNYEYSYKPALISNLTNIRQISASNSSSAFLSNENEIYGCGHNGFGQLGLPERKNSKITKPELVPDLQQIKDINQIACGRLDLLILTDIGKVYSIKDKSFLFGNMTNISQISISRAQSNVLVLDENGDVYGSGFASDVIPLGFRHSNKKDNFKFIMSIYD